MKQHTSLSLWQYTRGQRTRPGDNHWWQPLVTNHHEPSWNNAVIAPLFVSLKCWQNITPLGTNKKSVWVFFDRVGRACREEISQTHMKTSLPLYWVSQRGKQGKSTPSCPFTKPSCRHEYRSTNYPNDIIYHGQEVLLREGKEARMLTLLSKLLIN